MSETPADGRLHVLKAIEDGWGAFTKAPWPFVLFTLLLGVLSIALQIVSAIVTSLAENEERVGFGETTVLTIIFMVGSWIVSLWGVTGMVRGSWIALEGRKPELSDFVRWDGTAAGRVFVRWIALGVTFLVIAAACVLAGIGLGQLNQWLIIIPAVVAIVLFTYLSVNQKFLPYVAMLEETGPMETIQRGRSAVDPSWWWVVLLLIVDTIIISIGALLCGVGLLVAAPLVGCITTAAYRQLFGTTDVMGLVSSD